MLAHVYSAFSGVDGSRSFSTLGVRLSATSFRPCNEIPRGVDAIERDHPAALQINHRETARCGYTPNNGLVVTDR